MFLEHCASAILMPSIVRIYVFWVDKIALTYLIGQYTEEQYKTLKRKIDRYLLPLMWLCYGIVSTPEGH